jgi:hypothetical protein
VFTAPRHARGFFEALIADNLDIGRPDHVEIIFGRKVARDPRHTFHTAIGRHNDGVVVNASFKHSRIKQYLNTVGRCASNRDQPPTDLGVLRRLHNLDELQARARDAGSSAPGFVSSEPSRPPVGVAASTACCAVLGSSPRRPLF